MYVEGGREAISYGNRYVAFTFFLMSFDLVQCLAFMVGDKEFDSMRGLRLENPDIAPVPLWAVEQLWNPEFSTPLIMGDYRDPEFQPQYRAQLALFAEVIRSRLVPAMNGDYSVLLKALA